MPRADPTRSTYCASRHLLRNLDNAAELRRNPLAKAYFAATPGLRRRDADRHALARIRGVVHATLGRCSEYVVHGRARVDLGRMHAALLRCEIDKQRLSVVAAELSLSERQVRRERRTAHHAFVQAFRRAEHTPPPATASGDLGALRLAEAVELHELAQTDLALAAFASVSAGADTTERHIEALCLAAEVLLDGMQHAAAAAHAAEAKAVLALRADGLDEPARAVATEHVEFVEWLFRWHDAVSGGVATPPPLAAAHADAAGSPDERRRALFVRASAAYATQRWEVGDLTRGTGATRAALAVLPSLSGSRTKERFAVLFAEAQLFALRARPGLDCDRFLAIERLAAERGHVRTMLAARAERSGSEGDGRPGGGNVFDGTVRAFDTAAGRTMSRALAAAAQIAAQCEPDPLRRIDAATLAERLVPLRSATGMMSRSLRTKAYIELGRYDDAWALAQSVRTDAEAVGNCRVRGGAAHRLAAIALRRGRRVEAERYVREALPLLERFGTIRSLQQANDIARRLRVN